MIPNSPRFSNGFGCAAGNLTSDKEVTRYDSQECNLMILLIL